MRTVSVRYLVPVYATVDLDAEPDEQGNWPDEAVVEVRLDTLQDHPEAFLDAEGDVLAESYVTGADNVDPGSLTIEDRAKVLDIVENAVWPAWDR